MEEVAPADQRSRDRDAAEDVLHALRALAAAPAERGGAAAAWGGTPVFAYGFDDFDRLQLEALDRFASRR